MRRLLITCLFASALSVAAGARAEEPPKGYPDCNREPTESDLSAAQGAFQAGGVSFAEGDYPRAITYWEDAYRRDCTAHKLLLNLARAYESDGQLRHAVVALETFNARMPDHPEVAANQRRIEKLKERIAEEEKPAAPAATPGATPPDDTATPPPEPPTEPGAEGGSRPILPLIVAGGGLVIAGIGAAIYFPAQSDVSEYEDQCNVGGERRCPNDQVAQDAQDARDKANLGGILTWGGVAVLGGGLIWYFLSPPEGGSGSAERPRVAKPESHVEPQLGRGYAGLSWSGRF